jgi:hypothetical protein
MISEPAGDTNARVALGIVAAAAITAASVMGHFFRSRSLTSHPST